MTEAESNEAGDVRLFSLMRYLFTMTHGMSLLAEVCKMHNEVTMLEQCSDYFRIQVPKQHSGQTIGTLFGLISREKDQCRLGEFSVTQTRLEQIFRGLA